MSGYEVREQEPTDLQRRYGVAKTVYVVWDTERDTKMPFGSYRTRGRAVARIQRMEAREAETT